MVYAPGRISTCATFALLWRRSGARKASEAISPKRVSSTQAVKQVLDAGTENQKCDGPPSPATFMCHQDELCAGLDEKGPTDLYGMLCLIASFPTTKDNSQTMASIVNRLPYRLLHNLTFKHGIEQTGVRGHSMEAPDLTTTAHVEQPRVVMWDEDTGFTFSFSGGPSKGVKEENRSDGELHMMAYDDSSGRFEFWSIDLPISKVDTQWNVRPYQPTEKSANCKRCHGEPSRPVWAMYPDWPGVFGSDTDELSKNNTLQTFEKKALARFRRCIVPGKSAGTTCAESGQLVGDAHERYASLYDKRATQGMARDFRDIDSKAIRKYLQDKADGDARRKPKYRLTKQALAVSTGGDEEMRQWLGLTLHENYPYRPNHELQKSEASRAIYHRPNLRIGALYNRLNSRRVLTLFRKSPVYGPFKKLIAFSLMDCGWSSTQREERTAVLAKFGAVLGKELSNQNMALPSPNSDGRILYPVLLAALGLQLRDVDIRFSNPNTKFDLFDRDYASPTYAKTVMDLGYIKYEARDNNQENGAVRYFNSYFDGSASFDELLVAQILEELGEDYAKLYTLNSFESKFSSVISRYQLDKRLFAKMDALSKWFPLPYPKHLKPLHNRQAFLRKRSNTYPFRDQHSAVCKQLRSDMSAGLDSE